MNRQDRRNYDRNEYQGDYGRYEGYSREDEHYHGARNLTDTFERDYQRERGHRNEDRRYRPHTYHEGNMGGAYERYRREGRDYGDRGGYQRNDWDQDRNRDYSNGFRGERDRYSSFWDDSREDQDRYRRDRDRSQGNSNWPQGYRISDRYNDYNRNDYRRAGDEQDYYYGSGDEDRTPRFGDRTYSGGTSYSGTYGSMGASRYDSNYGRNTRGSWIDTDRKSYLQNRYY